MDDPVVKIDPQDKEMDEDENPDPTDNQQQWVHQYCIISDELNVKTTSHQRYLRLYVSVL